MKGLSKTEQQATMGMTGITATVIIVMIMITLIHDMYVGVYV